MTIDQPYRCPPDMEQRQIHPHPQLFSRNGSKAQLPQNQNRRTLAILMVSILMDFIGFGIVMPLLPFYAQFFGASSWEVGILLGLFPLMSIVAPTLWGNLSDRIGRRPALLFNVAGTTVSYLLLSAANSLTMLFLSRLLAGATSASIVIGQSYASDLSTTENRTKVLSILEAASGIGIVIGLAISSALVGNDTANPNFLLPSLAAMLASGLTFCLTLLALPRIKRKAVFASTPSKFHLQRGLSELRTTFQRPLVGMVMIVAFALFFSILGGEAIFAMWCDQQFGWGPQQFGYLIIFYFLAIASIQIGLTGRLARWVGEPKLLLWSLAALTMGLFLRPFSSTVPQLVGSMIFVIFAEATGIPTFTSLLSRLSGARQQGRTLGLMQSVSGVGGFVGASGAGYVFGAWGMHWPYWISALLMAIAALVCWKYITQTRLVDVMDRRRRTKLLRLFDLLDHNKSGTLELNDFHQAGKMVAKLRGWEPGTTEYDIVQVSFIGFGEMLQQLADRDGNRRVDQSEWLHAFLDQPIDEEFASLFLQIFDINQDHQIAFEELRTFYQAYNISTDHLEDVFHTLDLDQDGRISTEEFDTIFAQFLYSDDVQAPGNWMFGVGLPRQL